MRENGKKRVGEIAMHVQRYSRQNEGKEGVLGSVVDSYPHE